MIGPVLLAVTRRRPIRRMLSGSPLTRPIVNRFVAGADVDAAVNVVRALLVNGLAVTIDLLGEDATEVAHTEATRDAYISLIDRLHLEGLTHSAEISVKLSALGRALSPHGEAVALDNLRTICAAAGRSGTTVTVDMEDHTTVDSTLEVLREVRLDFPSVGVALQSNLVRTGGDVRDLAHAGSRVRLVKGAYTEPRGVAYSRKSDVDDAYRRHLDLLFFSEAYPMVATHDSVMLAEAGRLAATYGKSSSDFELQMLYGVRPSEQERQARAGRQMRIYVPYGKDWYEYFTRRLAERPANIGFLLRSLLSR